MQETLQRLGLLETNSGACTGNEWLQGGSEILESVSPIDGRIIGETVHKASTADLERVILRATEAFQEWRMTPAPRRGGDRAPDWKRFATIPGRSGLSGHPGNG